MENGQGQQSTSSDLNCTYLGVPKDRQQAVLMRRMRALTQEQRVSGQEKVERLVSEVQDKAEQAQTATV